MASRNWIDLDPKWAWLDQIQPGDILYEGGDPERARVVRNVSRKKNGVLYGVYFSILHCSWTGRPYTLLIRSDLKTRRFTPSGARKEAFSFNEKLLHHDVMVKGGDIRKLRMTCCSVKGIR
jgi:hypothetical protein